MQIRRLTQKSMMCERLGCGKAAALVLEESPDESEGESSWMVAYCDEHAGEVGYAAMMDAPTEAKRRGPGRRGSDRTESAAAS